MNIIAHGIDLIECGRIEDIWQRHGERFIQRLLTPAEWTHVQRHRHFVPSLSGRFAAKEAILKVLGTGLRGQMAWRDMEILNDPLGQPIATLTGACCHRADELGIVRVLISITHTHAYAAASAIGIGQ